MKAAAPHVPPYCLDERLRDLSFETDQTMIDDVQTKTHVVCADAASDEQLGMKILSGADLSAKRIGEWQQNPSYDGF